jgi:hypothetical protein
MTKTLKTMTLSMALAGMFLSAGAFAGAGLMPTPAIQANVTVIHKNSIWPIKGLISTNTCALARCVQA